MNLRQNFSKSAIKKGYGTQDGFFDFPKEEDEDVKM